MFSRLRFLLGHSGEIAAFPSGQMACGERRQKTRAATSLFLWGIPERQGQRKCKWVRGALWENVFGRSEDNARGEENVSVRIEERS